MSKARETLKLLVLHGPAIESSRKKLIEIRQKFDPDNVLVFDPSAHSTSSGQVLDSLLTVPMFGGEQLVILENPPEDTSELLTINRELLTLILWFDHEVDPEKYAGAQVFFFPEAKEVSVFPFLDLLGQRDKKAFLELDKLRNAGYENQYFITMIFYLLRNLVATPKTAKDFVKNKNSRMRANFSPEELMQLYKFILEIDFKIKKGLLEPDQADFSLTQKFVGI